MALQIPSSGSQTMAHFQSSAQKHTQVSAKLTSQIFSKQFPKTNCFFSPLSIYYMINNYIAQDTAKGNTLKELLGFLKTKTIFENDHLYAHFDNVLKKAAVGCFEITYRTLVMPIGTILMYGHYAQGGWFELFEFSELKEGEFHVSDGKKVKVVMMCKEKKDLLYGEYDGFKVVGFPHFEGGKQEGDCKFTMYVFLPDEKDGLEALVEKIGSASDEFFDTHFPEEKVEVNEFGIPLFQVSSEFDVVPSLKEMGLALPFSVQHGMHEMFDPSKGKNVCVNRVHQNYGFSLMMNQTGSGPTPAAAAALEGGCLKKKAGEGCLVETKVVDFVVDRPFLFVIRDEVTKVIFFVGQMIDPTVKIQKMWYPNSRNA